MFCSFKLMCFMCYFREFLYWWGKRKQKMPRTQSEIPKTKTNHHGPNRGETYGPSSFTFIWGKREKKTTRRKKKGGEKARRKSYLWIPNLLESHVGNGPKHPNPRNKPKRINPPPVNPKPNQTLYPTLGPTPKKFPM